MEVQEILRLKKELQNSVIKQISDFEKITGVSVASLSIERVSIEASSAPFLTNVKAKIEFPDNWGA